jgi:hypothetical protein
MPANFATIQSVMQGQLVATAGHCGKIAMHLPHPAHVCQQLLWRHLVDVQYAVAACYQQPLLVAPGQAEYRPASGHHLWSAHTTVTLLLQQCCWLSASSACLADGSNWPVCVHQDNPWMFDKLSWPAACKGASAATGAASCRHHTCSRFPLSVHTPMLPSIEPENSSLALVAYARHVTMPLCTVWVRSNCPVFRSQTCSSAFT